MMSVDVILSSKLSLPKLPWNVLLGVPVAITVDGAPFVRGVVETFDYGMDDNGKTLFDYGVTFDEAQLLSPDSGLDPSSITGMVACGILTDYINWMYAHQGPEFTI